MKNKALSFSLVEALISIALFTMVSFVIYFFFMVGIGSWEIGTANTELQALARQATDFMVAELKEASPGHPTRGITILPAPNNNNIIFYLPVQDAEGDTVIGADSQIQWPADDLDYIQYRYQALTRQLIREDRSVREGLTAAKVLTNDSAGVQFINAGIDGALFLDEVNIILDLQRNTPGGRNLTFSMRSTVKLRN